jgi:putative heme-binding domain-containing protein
MTSILRNLRPRICLLSGLLTLAAGSVPAAENPIGKSPEVIAEGHQIFNKLCTACHGVDGAAGDRGPAMAASRRYLRRANEELFEAIQKGIPGSQMPPMNLPENDAWKIVAWIRSMRARAIEIPVDGDRDQGAEIFWGKGDCGRCHVIRGRGGLLGPDLTNLGAEMSLRQIREALTVEKPRPPLGYRPVTVTTKDGLSFSGVSKNEHNFSLQMIGEDNRLHLFSSDELEEIVYGETSMMPSDYDKRFSETEFQSVLAFLSRLSLREYDPNQRGGRNRR